MTEAREVTRDTYYAIQDKAHDLFMAIHAAMDSVRRDAPEIQTDEWSELHELSKLANAVSGLAHSFARQAPSADDPVPFTLAEPPPSLLADLRIRMGIDA